MVPTLQDGDAVLVDMTRQLSNPPGIIILDDGMGLAAKRVDYIPNSDPPEVRVISGNPLFPASGARPTRSAEVMRELVEHGIETEPIFGSLRKNTPPMPITGWPEGRMAIGLRTVGMTGPASVASWSLGRTSVKR